MLIRLACLGLVVGACSDNDTPPDPPPVTDVDAAVPAPDAPAPDAPPAATPPRIVRLTWEWQGCVPDPDGTEMALTVTVDVESIVDHYKIKGQATACEPFTDTGQTKACEATPTIPARILGATVESALGTDTESTPITDCVDGKWEPPA